jgi:lambda family phage portal protein
MAVSGECFCLLQIDPNASPVPLSLRLLTPDFLDGSRTDTSTRAGIEFDSSGRRSAYWFHVVHPQTATPERSVRVPAEDVIHLFRQLQPGQQRGVSWLAPVLLNLKELDEYMGASLTKQKTAALFCGAVTSPEGANLLNGNNDGVPGLEPGSMIRLKPGEGVDWSNPPDNSDFDPFVRSMLRRIASGLNIPYGALSGDYSNVSYASGRHSKIDFQQFVEYVQYGLLTVQLCIPVLKRWLELARSLELIPDSGEADPRWIAPSLPLIDPQREIAGTIAAIRGGLISRSEAVRRSGWSSEQIDQENAADNQRGDRLGLAYDSDPRRTSQQGQTQISQEVQE